MCLMGLGPMLLFGWSDVHSEAAAAGQADGAANEKWSKQSDVNKPPAWSLERIMVGNNITPQ